MPNPCPDCGGELRLSKDGTRAKCLSCNREFRRKGKPRKEDKQIADSESGEQPTDQASEPTGQISAKPRPSRRKKQSKNAMLIIGGMVVGVIAVILFGSVVFRPSATNTPSDDGPAGEGYETIVQQPVTTQPDDQVASNVQTNTDTDDSRETKIAEPPVDSPRRTQLRKVAWSEAPFVQALQSPNVRLDGIAVFDGVLFAEWSGSLVCPAGRHVVASDDNGPKKITVKSSYPEYYLDRLAEVSRGGRLDRSLLLAKTNQVHGIFSEPVLPHLWGNFFWQEQQPEAAIRYWQTAVRTEPAYAPAHLNLGFALSEQGNNQEAAREFQLAQRLNLQDAFGIRGHLISLQSRFTGLSEDSPTVRLADYSGLSGSQQKLTAEQQDALRILRSLGRFVTKETEQIKVTNNIGVYLMSEGFASAALPEFQSALSRLAGLGSLRKNRELAQHLFQNMARAAAAEQMPEAMIYQELSKGFAP